MGQSDASRRVLVTGALGVVGVWVLRALLEREIELLATDLRPDFGLAPELHGVVRFSELDITDRQAVGAVLDEFRPTVVIHLAALMTGETEANPYRGFDVHVRATANLLEESRRTGVVRLVFASSKGAYGAARGRHGYPSYEPLKEDDPCSPAQLYDYAKLFCEGLGATYRETGGPEFVALRFATIYGPGKLARHGPMALASRVIEDSLAGRSVRIPTGADEKDEYIYVRDVASALLAAALKSSPTAFALYNAGSGDLRSTAELAAIVRSVVPSSDIEVGPGLDPMGLGIPYYFVFDSSRARSDLGFEARYDLESGVRDYIRAMALLDPAAPEPAVG